MFRWMFLLVAAALLAACSPPETQLDVKSQVLSGDRVEVSGETSLPDGAQLNVSLRQPNLADPVVVGLPVVKGGRFAVTLDPQADLKAGDYQVLVEFSPKAFAWSKDVLPAVGSNGEKLGGPHVHDSGEGWKMLKLEQAVTLP